METTKLQPVNPTALAKRAAEVAARIADEPEVLAAMHVAGACKGIVVASPEAAKQASEQRGVLKRAIAMIDDWQRKCLALPKAIDHAIRAANAQRMADLKIAYDELGQAHTAWVVSEQRRAEEERLAKERAAVTAAAASGDDDLPAMIVADKPVATIARGDDGSATYVVYDVEVEEIDHAAACCHHPELFAIKMADAKGFAREAMEKDAVELKKTGIWIVRDGLRMRFKPRSATK